MESKAPSEASRPVAFIFYAGLIFAIIGFVQLVLFLGGFISTTDIAGFLIPLIGIVMIIMGVQLVLMAGKIRRV
jgi:hypothetical protein